MLCGTSMYNKYLSTFNLKTKIAKQERCGRNLNLGEIFNFFHWYWPSTTMGDNIGDRLITFVIPQIIVSKYN
jgi:hypothetical protein